jgi:hypothetical protein
MSLPKTTSRAVLCGDARQSALRSVYSGTSVKTMGLAVALFALGVIYDMVRGLHLPSITFMEGFN